MHSKFFSVMLPKIAIAMCTESRQLLPLCVPKNRQTLPFYVPRKSTNATSMWPQKSTGEYLPNTDMCPQSTIMWNRVVIQMHDLCLHATPRTRVKSSKPIVPCVVLPILCIHTLRFRRFALRSTLHVPFLHFLLQSCTSLASQHWNHPLREALLGESAVFPHLFLSTALRAPSALHDLHVCTWTTTMLSSLSSPHTLSAIG